MHRGEFVQVVVNIVRDNLLLLVSLFSDSFPYTLLRQLP